MKSQTFTGGAITLMLAGLVVRLLGFVNRVFMSNMIGAEGMGLFQLTSPVYSLIILTLTSGISITVSSLTAGAKARGETAAARKTAFTAFILLLVSGSIVGLSLIGASDFIAVKILRDPRTKLCLVMLAPCIPAVASASAIKGYFYGMSQVKPTAAAQIVEQVVRIGVIFFLSSYLISHTSLGKDLAWVCALATVSSAIGEMANLGVVGFFFIKERKWYPKVSARPGTVKLLLKGAAPVSVNRFILSVMGMAESVILPMCFFQAGMDRKSGMEMLGRIGGMAMPLIMFPSVVTSAIATTLVAAISDSVAVGNYTLTNKRINRSVSLSFIMGFGFFSFFYIFGKNIGDMIYPGENVGEILSDLSFCCILLYFQQTMTGILNGLGKQMTALLSSLAGYVLRMSITIVGVPLWGVKGYILGNIAGMLISSFIDILCIAKYTRMKPDIQSWLLVPSVASGMFIMIAGSLFSVNIIIAMISASISYLLVLFVSGKYYCK